MIALTLTMNSLGVTEAGQDAFGDFAALDFVFVADVGFAPVAAEAFGDDAVFIDVRPTGVMQQGRNQHEFSVCLWVGVAQSVSVGHR